MIKSAVSSNSSFLTDDLFILFNFILMICPKTSDNFFVVKRQKYGNVASIWRASAVFLHSTMKLRPIGGKQFSVFCNALNSYKAEGSLYIHWPYCQKLCIYCNFNKYANPERRQGINFEQQMEKAFLKETETLLQLSHIRLLKSIYFGGGTPSLASLNTIRNILSNIRSLVSLDPDVEITIECNPSSLLDHIKLEGYRLSGVNRISVGLQSTNDTMLTFLGRDHSFDQSCHLLANANHIFGFESVSIDLLYGKPKETVETWTEELNRVLELGLSHLSLYELTPERGTPLYKMLQGGKIHLPEVDTKAAMYEIAAAILPQAGLLRYEVANFAVPGRESHHNLNYWNGVQYVGVGPGAHGRFYTRNEDLREARIQISDPLQWEQSVAREGHGTRQRRQQSSWEILEELVATSLRTVRGVQQSRWSIFQPQYTLRDVFSNSPTMALFFNSGHLQWLHGGDLRASDAGLMVLDSILPAAINAMSEFRQIHQLN